MADGYTQGVGSISAWQAFEFQQTLHHRLHLRFLRLALPDVTEIAVTAQDANGAAVVPTAIVLKRDAEGWYVQADGPATATRVFVNMTCAMPAHLLPMVKTAVIMLVGHWFEHREAVSDVTMGEVPMSVNALLAPLRRAAF